MNVCVIGASLPNGNYGVQALASGLVNIFQKLDPNVSLSFLCVGRKGSYSFRLFTHERDWTEVQVVNYRLSPRAAWKEHILFCIITAFIARVLPPALRNRLFKNSPVLATIKDADFVGDIRGGDSFSDIYGFRRLFEGSLPAFLALAAGKRLVLFPQTYGPYKYRVSKILASFLMRKSSYILARDSISYDVAETLSNDSGKIELSPDVAFSLSARLPDDPKIESPMPSERPDELIGLNISGLLYNIAMSGQNMFRLKESYPDIMRSLLEHLSSLPGTHVLIVPHMTRFNEWNIESDIHASRSLLDEIPLQGKNRFHLVTGDCDQHELKYIIGQCDFFIGSRMHSCIAALSQGIPTVGIAYSRKFEGVFDSVGLKECALNATSLTKSSLLCEFQKLHQNTCAIRKKLQNTLPNKQRILDAAFRNLCSTAMRPHNHWDNNRL